MNSFKTSNAKDRILGKIQNGLSKYRASQPFPEADQEGNNIYAQHDIDPEELFASEFIKLGGKFIFCDNEQELLEQIQLLYDSKGWKDVLCTEHSLMAKFTEGGLTFVHAADPSNDTADACITFCETLVARTGSVLLSSKQTLGRVAPVFYPHHIIVAYAHQVVQDIDKGFDHLKNKYHEGLPSMINLNTGPSRTADIEKTLVVGVHGPKEVYCFFINSQQGHS